MKRVLDHGSVTLIETWGSDERIIEAARMSTGKGFNGWGDQGPPCFKVPEKITACEKGVVGCPLEHKPGDEKLLAYLYEHKHMTPFEMAGMVIEVKAPIFVFREWHRHRTQSYNEMSARYIPLPDENYVPTVWRLMMQGGANKQAQATKPGEIVPRYIAEQFRIKLRMGYAQAQGDYDDALGAGVPKELARLILPVGRYSRMRASANLRNWLQFLTLRMDSAAQYEIRLYANAVGDLIEQHFPHTWGLFNKGIERIGGRLA